MTKNFNLQEDEKLCIFVTKDKKASYYFDNDFEYLQVLVTKAVLNFLFLIVI